MDVWKPPLTLTDSLSQTPKSQKIKKSNFSKMQATQSNLQFKFLGNFFDESSQETTTPTTSPLVHFHEDLNGTLFSRSISFMECVEPISVKPVSVKPVSKQQNSEQQNSDNQPFNNHNKCEQDSTAISLPLLDLQSEPEPKPEMEKREPTKSNSPIPNVSQDQFNQVVDFLKQQASFFNILSTINNNAIINTNNMNNEPSYQPIRINRKRRGQCLTKEQRCPAHTVRGKQCSNAKKDEYEGLCKKHYLLKKRLENKK